MLQIVIFKYLAEIHAIYYSRGSCFNNGFFDFLMNINIDSILLNIDV